MHTALYLKSLESGIWSTPHTSLHSCPPQSFHSCPVWLPSSLASLSPHSADVDHGPNQQHEAIPFAFIKFWDKTSNRLSACGGAPRTCAQQAKCTLTSWQNETSAHGGI
eukprot:6337120-Amphidinium_carterae.1